MKKTLILLVMAILVLAAHLKRQKPRGYLAMQPHAQAPHYFLNSAKRQEKLFFAYMGITFTNLGHVAKSLRRGPLDRCFFTSEGLQIKPMIRPPSPF